MVLSKTKKDEKFLFINQITISLNLITGTMNGGQEYQALNLKTGIIMEVSL